MPYCRLLSWCSVYKENWIWRIGPALRSGRANIQFKSRGDLIDFIINGSVNGKGYGVNGVGGGKMPGFGAVLPKSDIALVIDYLRGMEPDA